MSIFRLFLENFSKVEKEYLRSGKITDQTVIDIITSITKKDGYTKFIFDVYNFNLGTQLKSDYEFLKKYLKKWYDLIKSYDKNVFPVMDLEDVNLDTVITDHIICGYIENQLNLRNNIISELKKIPTKFLRNLKNEFKKVRSPQELSETVEDVQRIVTFIIALDNRPDEFKNAIFNKAFSSKHKSFKDVLDFFENKNNIFSEITNFNVNDIKKIAKKHPDIDLIFNRGDIYVFEVTSQDAIRKLGCFSTWCFSYGKGDETRDWYNYSHNGMVYVFMDLSLSPFEDNGFMYTLIHPLIYDDNTYENDEDYDGSFEQLENEGKLFDLYNNPVDNPWEIIDDLIGLDNYKKYITFGEY